MQNLRAHLNKMLPNILPGRADKAITGIDALKLLRSKYNLDLGSYGDGTIKVHLSQMSHEPNSVIAKVEGGHGYFARDTILSINQPPDNDPPCQNNDHSQTRQNQPEEKFRAIFIRYARLNDEFPVHIEHTKALRQSEGTNRWRYPDCVVLQWDVAIAGDNGFQLAKDLLEVKRGLGEPPFVLKSVELKVLAVGSNLREAFFQTVSNSKWAHEAQLVFATAINDNSLADELRRLGKSYDVSVFSYGLPEDYLDSLPPADQILAMDESQFEQIASNIHVTQMVSSRTTEKLDWDAIKDLRTQLQDFNHLFMWIAHCLEERIAFAFEDFLELSKFNEKYA
jgi:hypothetical protein